MTATSTRRRGLVIPRRNSAHPGPESNRQNARLRLDSADLAPALIDAAQQAANREIADEIVYRQVAYHMESGALPPLIAGFLEHRWRFYLTRMYVLEGEQGPRWLDALRAMDELIWVLQPKRSRESRERALGMLPQLFQWLHTGMQYLSLERAEEDAFFAELTKLCAAVLRPRMRLSGAVAPEVASSEGSNGCTIDVSRQADDGIRTKRRVDKKRPSSPRPGLPPALKDSHLDHLQYLPLNAALEYQDQRATPRQLRLTWISGGRGVFQFQDGNGDLICMTASRLRECLRGHSVRILTK